MSNVLEKKWYVLQSTAGFELKAKKTLSQIILNSNLIEFFGEILVPTESVFEIKCGKKTNTKKKFFPGYILVNMVITDETFKLVKSVPHINGFIGSSGGKPTSISDKEVSMILDQLKISSENPRHKFIFEPGETIRVTEGPFSDFSGIVEKTDYSRERLQVLISIFGRTTPIELGFNQVIKEN